MLIALGISGIGAWLIRWDKRRKAERLQAKGKENARAADLEAKLVCIVCDKPVNPDQDVFAKKVWWCHKCYQDTVH